MVELRNTVVRVSRFGGPEVIEVADAPMPEAGRGEVRVRVLASSIVYTDVTIRRHAYPQTMGLRPPFVLGYDVVGEIDQVGEGVTGLATGERVADMTVVGSNAGYRTLRAADVTPVPRGVDPAEAASLILSWTTAYQLLHRLAHVRAGQRVLVQGAAGAVGQALLTLGRSAGLELWGTGRREHAEIIRQLGARPIDYERTDFTQTPGGFDVIFDGVGEGDFGRVFAALRPGGLICAYGYTARMQAQKSLLSTILWLGRTYVGRSLTGWLQGGKRIKPYSINLMRARHPDWFKADLARLLEMLSAGEIHPRVAERISFSEVKEAHRRLEEGTLAGKLVLCPDQEARAVGAPTTVAKVA